MSGSQKSSLGKHKYQWGLLFLFIAMVCMVFGLLDNNDFDLAKREILLRRIGHEILLQSGDSTSRVLPIKKMAENEYQISFEHPFSFQPESLVRTTQQLLATDPFASDYIVNVHDCKDASVVYGYAISKNKKDEIVTCKGRTQTKACYMITIKFKPTIIGSAKNGYVLGSLACIAFVGLIFLKSKKMHPAEIEHQITQLEGQASGLRSQSNNIITLGAITFYAEDRQLVVNGRTTVDLTTTEARVLLIFSLCPNQTIERSRLQKEIWEDQGVIVGRSLDMFISKLRKKLELDPNLKIVVIRGKGYKLQCP